MSTTRARTSGPRTPDASDLRAKILSASVALIEEEGLGRLSMREVARRAGVTHQAPYHYFADREAILAQIAEDGFVLLTQRVESAMRPRDGAADRICAMGQAYVEFACDHPAHFRIMFRPELVNMENCPGARDAGSRAFSTLTGIVHAAVESGLPGVPSETALVALLWSVAHGLACLILDGPLMEKLPGPRNELVGGVRAALRSLLVASMPQPTAAAKSGKPKKARKPLTD
jgi:AcrR family transcriptional regulator